MKVRSLFILSMERWPRCPCRVAVYISKNYFISSNAAHGLMEISPICGKMDHRELKRLIEKYAAVGVGLDFCNASD